LGNFANSETVLGPSAEMWRRTLLQIPTRFGRLAFLSGLRDRTSGRYTHLPLIESVGLEMTDRTLCHSHHQVFSEWIALSLAEQMADLEEYLGDSPPDSAISRYRELAPAAAHDVERLLYLTDLETLLQLLRFGHGAAL
jgi:hypothetical protein